MGDFASIERDVKPSNVCEWLRYFSSYGALPNGGVTRLAFTDEEAAAKAKFIELCEAEHLSVRIDPIGNIVARRDGLESDAPAIACGSHLDSVREGGNYDGTLGVLAGLDVIHRLNQRGTKTLYPIEVIAFSSEESSRFGVSTIGSKAMSGQLDVALLERLRDAEGITLKEALYKHGLQMEKVDDAIRKHGELAAFLELHIEQGPSLEASGRNIGVVHAIAAPTRMTVQVIGEAGHSGTTAMSLRKDALAAAAELILAVETLAREDDKYQSVGTVGVIQVKPGSANTIPGEVNLVVEFRSTDLQTKEELLTKLVNKMSDIQSKRRVTFEQSILGNEKPVLLDTAIGNLIRKKCEETGCSYLDMASGAGHDAMNMASLCPTGLIFVPSVKGVSHHASEFTHDEDILRGVDVLYSTILSLAKEVV